MKNNILDKIVFRKLNEKDKKAFIDLRIIFLIDCFNSINKSINELDKMEIENNLNIYFENHINKEDFIGMVCEYNGKIVSAAYLIMLDYPAYPGLLNGKAGKIINVYTYPEYRKKGIAKKLMEELINEAKINGIKSIDLKSTGDGYELYKKLGFVDDNSFKNMILEL